MARQLLPGTTNGSPRRWIVPWAWPVCGEADHGLVAAMEAACTILYEDPILGWVALGGQMTRTNEMLGVRPRDGVRQRFHALLSGGRCHLALDRDGFKDGEAVLVSRTSDRVEFQIESRSPVPHDSGLRVEGLPPGRYVVAVGDDTRSFRCETGHPAVVRIPVDPIRSNLVKIAPSLEVPR